MSRYLQAGGVLIAMMGGALIPPVMASRTGTLTTLGIGLVSLGCVLIACGMTAVLIGFRRRAASTMPSGVRAAVAANVLFLAFFALEFSDGMVRQNGRIFYWTTVLFLPVLLLFCGLLAAKRWAWWSFRGAAAFGTLWFLGFLALIPFVNLQSEGGPVPWQGRVYMACVTLVFAGTLASAFWSLGRPETRTYFGLDRAAGSPPS